MLNIDCIMYTYIDDLGTNINCHCIHLYYWIIAYSATIYLLTSYSDCHFINPLSENLRKKGIYLRVCKCCVLYFISNRSVELTSREEQTKIVWTCNLTRLTVCSAMKWIRQAMQFVKLKMSVKLLNIYRPIMIGKHI